MTILIPDAWGDIDALVVGAISTSVILSFILLVIIFAMRYKAQNERVVDLKRLIREKDENTNLLMENIRRLQAVDSEREAKLIRCAKLEEHCNAEKRELMDRLALANKKIASLESRVSELTIINERLEKNYHKAKENMEKALEEVEKSQKRNEFWVEQLSELRTKYEALKVREQRAMNREIN